MKKARKIITAFLSAVILLGLFPAMPVYASGTVTVSVSASTVNIGDTVKVTATPKGPSGETVNAFLTFTFDSSKFSFVECSEGSNYGGGGGGTVTVTGVESASITLKATAAGSASVSVAGSDLVASSDGTTEYGEASAGGTTITVNNAASSGSSSSGSSTASDTGSLSGDNSLKSLTISPGTLSPSFKYSTTSYTASVGSDVTSIAVSAVTSNANASIESVTGNENLTDGQNTVKIVVKAENGVTATYTIVVTKGGTASSETDSEEESETEETTQETDAVSGIVVNEIAYTISEDFDEEDIPEDFSIATVNYQGIDYQGVAFDKGNVVMLYLVPQEGGEEGQFFVYDSNRGSFYSYVRITYGERYLIALLPPQDTEIPSSYAQSQLELEDFGTITAYQQVMEDETVSEFFLFYAINNDGTEGWYQYDSAEGTYQRLNGTLEEEEETETTDLEYLQNQYNELSEKYANEKSQMRKLAAALIVICVILIIIIINLLLRGGKGRSQEDDENDEYDEYDDEDGGTVEQAPSQSEEADVAPQEETPAAEDMPDEADDYTDDEFMKELEEKETPKKKKKKTEEKEDIEVLDLNDL